MSEQELTRKALASSGKAVNEKFIKEILWRTYWKGYMERRPSIWDSYQQMLQKPLSEDLSKRIAKATDGSTGIDAFDAWISELNTSGYLHNHARMWFASIWIHTLKLPWYWGAELFLDRLIDGDPAVNTLSWRWVAGLHTKGKTYLARKSNIVKYTKGRFEPSGLSDEAPLIEESIDHPLTSLVSLPHKPSLNSYDGLIVTMEDLTVDENLFAKFDSWPQIIMVDRKKTVFEVPDQFRKEAFEDAKLRLGKHSNQPVKVISCFSELDANGTYVGYLPPVGKVKDLLQNASDSVQFDWLRRPWDDILWPESSGGFFKYFKKGWPLIQSLLEKKGTQVG